MAYTLKVPKQIVKLVRSMNPALKKRVRSSFQTLCRDPLSGKALKHELEGLRNFRVSRFPIIYRVARSEQIALVAVWPRITIYKETFKSINKDKEQ